MADRDGLKPLYQIMKPDTRNTCNVLVNRETGEQRAYELEDHYKAIEQYALHNEVPSEIATQYDVARNIYVYAWFEYRFYNAAEAHVLIALEFALKERIGDVALKAYIKQRKDDHRKKTGKGLRLNRGMKILMEYCRDHQLVKNEGFKAWRQYSTNQAYHKAHNEQFEWSRAEMERTGQSEIELPEIPVVQLPPDLSYDHVQHLIDHVNKHRNGYAHGSSMLHSNVLNRFEMVSEFINQLFN